MLVVSMCDHDHYLGTGTTYPNNPVNPDAEVNGLQATMAAIDYTTANYLTTHVFVHGTSAGSVGAYAVGMSYASEGVALTGIVSDSILGSRGWLITEFLADEPDFSTQQGYSTAAFNEKVGPWAEANNLLLPEYRFGAGFNMTPNLMIGGLVDLRCGADHEPIPEAAVNGFDNNCEWMAEPLKVIADQPENSLEVVYVEDKGHVPTIDAGIANDAVDAFLSDILGKNPDFPFTAG